MAINTLGLTQALTSAGEGYNSGYYGALGTVYSRGLAQQKQASESNLQAAQASQYATDNPTKLAVAQTLGQSRLGVAGIQSTARQNIAMGIALGNLPAKLAGQTAAEARATLRSMDALDPNGHLEENYFAGDNAGLVGDPNAHQPIFGSGGAPPMLPPGGPVGIPAMSFSAPGVGLSGMGMNTPAAPPITGVSPALPLPSGPIGNAPSVAAVSQGGFGGSLSGLSGAGGVMPSGVSQTLPPPSGPIGSLPPPSATGPAPAAPPSPSGALPSVVSPTLPPPSGPIGNTGGYGSTGVTGNPNSAGNPFSPSPLTLSQIRKNNAGASDVQNKMDLAFRNQLGLTPPAQQPQMVQQFNARNGTNYAVPGTQQPPTLPDGTPALGPPSLAPSYVPNSLQAATIAGKNAQTSAIGDNYGLKVQQFKSLQEYQNALMGAKQQEIGLQRQGLSEKTAHDSVMANIAQQNVNARGGGLAGNGVAGDALTARLNQRMTTLTMPGKSDMFGKPGAALVTLDPQGNPSGPGAAEYHQLQALMQGHRGGAASPVNPMGGGYGVIPSVGSQVRGVSGPSVPALPGFPSNLPGANRAGGYTGPIPNSQADFQRMTPQQKYDYKNIYLRGLNGGR